MYKIASLKKNVILTTFYEILKIITPFLTAPYLSRVLGIEGIGINSYTCSIQAYFCMLAALGTGTYGSREIARVRDDQLKTSETFWEIEFQLIITTTIMLCAWGFFILNVTKYKIYFTVLSLGILGTMFDISWFFSGIEQYKHIVKKNTLVKILEIVMIFTFVKKPEHLLYFIIINTFSMFFGNISMWIDLPKYLVKVKFKNLRIFRHIKYTLIYFLPTIASSIYLIFDKTLLGLITQDEKEIGYYEQANKVITLLKSLTFASITSVMNSRVSYLFKQEKFDEIKTNIEITLNFIMLIGLGCCFGIIGIADNFVPIFFGEGYDKVSFLIKLSSPLVVIVGISCCLGATYYRPIGYIKRTLLFVSSGALINLVLNIILIPKYKSVGAIIGSVIAEAVISYLYVKFSNGFLTFKQIFFSIWKKIIAGFIMMISVTFIGKIDFNYIIRLFVQVASGIIIYSSCLFIERDKYFKLFCNMIFSKLKKITQFKNQ